MTTTTTNGPLISKAEAAKRSGIPVSTWDYWVKIKALPYVQPAGNRGKIYFSARLVDSMIRRADGQYVAMEPDFSQPLPGSEENEFTNIVVMETSRFYNGPVHQSRRPEFDAYVDALASGKTRYEAIAASEAVARTEV